MKLHLIEAMPLMTQRIVFSGSAVLRNSSQAKSIESVKPAILVGSTSVLPSYIIRNCIAEAFCFSKQVFVC